MDDAGYAPVSTGDPDSGVVLGTYSAGGQATNEYLEALFRGGPSGAPALLFNSTVGNAAAGLAGLEYKLCGPNATVSQKEASGLAAIATAVDLLRLRRASAIAAGGTDAIFDIFYRAHDRFAVMNAGEAAGRGTAPFDAARSGFVMGEGAYMLWLQPSGTATARSHGEVLGTGAASAITGLNTWPRDPDDLARTMRLAIEDAEGSAEDIDVVYASANADRALDSIEAKALAQVFGDARPIVTSIKGAIGECGASSAAACVAAILCGAAGFVPPIAGLEQVDAAASTLNIASAAVQTPGEIVLVNSIASGGALCSVVLRVPRQH
jgi:3-oxoacyl-[acyl-carrier-protein] synthase II